MMLQRFSSRKLKPSQKTSDEARGAWLGLGGAANELVHVGKMMDHMMDMLKTQHVHTAAVHQLSLPMSAGHQLSLLYNIIYSWASAQPPPPAGLQLRRVRGRGRGRRRQMLDKSQNYFF